MTKFVLEILIPFLTYFSFAIGFIHLIVLEKGLLMTYVRKYCRTNFNAINKLLILFLLFLFVPVVYVFYSSSLFGLSLLQLVPVISCFYYLKNKVDRAKLKKGVQNGFLL